MLRCCGWCLVLCFFVWSYEQYTITALGRGEYPKLLNNKEFRFFLIGLNSIFSTLPQSEYTSRAVSTPRVSVYFCLLSIRCFNVVQPETRFHFQWANQIAKKVQNFQNFQKFQKISKFKFKKKSKFS